MAVYSYTRVSTLKGQTTDNQDLLITEAGFTIDKAFSDTGISGTVPAFDRPAFKEMLSLLVSGDQVIVTAIDRLGRNASNILSVVEYFKDIGIKLRFVQFDNVDITSAMGKVILTCMAAFAELERKLIQERVVAGLNRTVAEGTILGAPRKTSPEALKSILEDIKAGVEHSVIAKQYGISLKTVGRYKRTYLQDKSRASVEEYSVLYNKQKEQISKIVVANI